MLSGVAAKGQRAIVGRLRIVVPAVLGSGSRCFREDGRREDDGDDRARAERVTPRHRRRCRESQSSDEEVVHVRSEKCWQVGGPRGHRPDLAGV